MRYEPATPDLWLLSTVGDVNEYVQDYDDVFRRGSSYYHSTGHYVVVCKSACTTRIGQNDWPLYLSRAGGEPVEASDFELTGPSVMHATYISRRAQRFTGLGLAIVGVGGGLALAVAGSSGDKADWGLVGTGGAVALAGLVFGAYFGFREDEARIEVAPLAPTEAPASTTPSSPAVSMRAPEGATLRLRF